MKILVAVHDLMFTSRINSVTKGVHEVHWLPRGTSVADKAKELRPDALVIDLGNAALKPVEAIAAVRADPDTKDLHVIAYVGHTEESIIAAAKSAGANEIYSKGEFNSRLPQLLGAK